MQISAKEASSPVIFPARMHKITHRTKPVIVSIVSIFLMTREARPIAADVWQ
jgi:hypothetical protein